jgi:hypothetical protein
MDFEPPNAADISRIVDKRLASRGLGIEESVAIDWREGKLSIPVISMPLELTYFNPNTRRIQAQRGIDPPRQLVLEEQPFSDVGQEYLEELLQWDPARPGTIDPAFEKLKEDLAIHGQDEPGLMTRSGLLINGNTRRAALKSLGKENIRVGVLPPDTGRSDLDALELSLQLRKTLKRDYSFVNELLAIRAEVDKGVPTAQILRAFRMKQERFERSLWLLDFINEAIERSKTQAPDDSGVSLRQFDFERDQGQLEELYRAWHNLNKTDPDKAAILRETRLLGVVLDFAKTDLRVMDESFFEKYVIPRLDPSDLPAPPDQAPKSVPGLPDVLLPAEAPGLNQVRTLSSQVLKAAALKKHGSPEAPAPEDATSLLSRVRRSYEEGRTRAGASAELRRKGAGPADKVLEAGDALDSAAEALTAAQAVDSLDVEALEDALENLRKSLIRLAQLLDRIPEDRKDAGFAWMIAAANAAPGAEG